ncbi:probable inactive ATP-dependent zinc metalloprotease FTSHI 5, chloroplastic isoform X1 [Rosa rugosa]|uniref:probable inactive ATP-dependent zinc metalloprotease FTSHI 5, chloroplastic isoform X1 n=1 Tax=Rosa rugosa TaxID=74645 RepID=UPI002B41438C|nr:probable inactive ATP-dependent zinc metalloprotease FTSHI 5, chloroplastic isoform X1 [Rosa rugosa]XP_061994366.1 probable inactive ATP-dependent zinc metalloprotease FTSHI 5, chloroplastic isoform X1 [Rosa rugosa]
MDKLTDAEAASPSLSLFAALSYRAASMAMVFINKAVLLMEFSNSMTLLTMQVPVEVPYWNQVFRDPGWALMVDIGRGKARNEGSGNGNAESRSYLEKKLVFCFGSHIAAQMLLPFGEKNLLSSSELTQAQEIDFILCFLLFNGINIATRVVIQYGWGPDDSPAIYYHSNASTALSMGNNHEYDMAVKVEKIHDLAHYKAKEMLHRNEW